MPKISLAINFLNIFHFSQTTQHAVKGSRSAHFFFGNAESNFVSVGVRQVISSVVVRSTARYTDEPLPLRKFREKEQSVAEDRCVYKYLAIARKQFSFHAIFTRITSAGKSRNFELHTNTQTHKFFFFFILSVRKKQKIKVIESCLIKGLPSSFHKRIKVFGTICMQKRIIASLGKYICETFVDVSGVVVVISGCYVFCFVFFFSSADFWQRKKKL
jgi:hypothetical protein